MKFKRIIAVLIILSMFCGIAYGAWTKEITNIKKFIYENGDIYYEIAMQCTSDSGSSGDITLSTQILSDKPNAIRWAEMEGGRLYSLEYNPSSTATPTTQATITLDTANGANFFDETVAVASTEEVFSGDVDSSFLVPLTDLIFASTTLASGETATFYIWIKK